MCLLLCSCYGVGGVGTIKNTLCKEYDLLSIYSRLLISTPRVINRTNVEVPYLGG